MNHDVTAPLGDTISGADWRDNVLRNTSAMVAP